MDTDLKRAVFDLGAKFIIHIEMPNGEVIFHRETSSIEYVPLMFEVAIKEFGKSLEHHCNMRAKRYNIENIKAYEYYKRLEERMAYSENLLWEIIKKERGYDRVEIR
jgi:hypothetical protein